MFRHFISQSILLSTLIAAGPAFASGWSFNVGYHNPPGATVGGNFMYLWTNWAVELGVGYIGVSEQINTDSKKDNQKNSYYTVGGDFNMKYLFRQGGFRPYLEGGVGTGISTSSAGDVSAGASITHPFGGAGLMFMGQSAYFYVGALVINAFEVLGGIGFNF